MREVKVLSELEGKVLCSRVGGMGTVAVYVARAIDVTDYCAESFVSRGDRAIVEFGSFGGDSLLRLKTRFKGCGPNTGHSSIPCLYKVGKGDKLSKDLRYTSGHLLDGWGLNMAELIDLIFQHAPAAQAA